MPCSNTLPDISVSSGAMEKLRDIHLPAPVPEAQSDWMTALLVVLLLAVLLTIVAIRLFSLPAWKREAVRQLRLHASSDPETARFEIAAILRRVAIHLDASGQSARLSGNDYAGWLDAAFSTDYFTAGAGASLAAGLYRPDPEFDAKAAIDRLTRMIRNKRGRT